MNYCVEHRRVRFQSQPVLEASTRRAAAADVRYASPPRQCLLSPDAVPQTATPDGFIRNQAGCEAVERAVVDDDVEELVG
jgi:hypothetical protein